MMSLPFGLFTQVSGSGPLGPLVCWMSPFVILWVSGLFCGFYFWWQILLVNNVDPNQMPHYVASDLGLHCLPMTILRVSR